MDNDARRRLTRLIGGGGAGMTQSHEAVRPRPWLLFDRGDLPRLRAVARTENGGAFFAHAVRYCERYLDPRDEIYFDYRERRNDYWRTRDGNFIVSGHLCALALMGWLAERRDFLEAAREAIFAIIEHRLADQVLGSGVNPYRGWRGNSQHDAGKFAFTIAFLHDTLQEVCSAEQRERLRLYAAETLRIGSEHIRWVRRTPPPHELTVPLDAMAYIDNNRDSRFLLGMSILATCLEQEETFDPERTAALARCGPAALSRSLRWSFCRDGAPFEGASYGCSALLFFLLCAQIFARAGRADRRGDVRFARIADFLVHEFVLQGGFFNNLNDCLDEVPAQILAYAGCRMGRESALWLWHTVCCNPASPSSVLGSRHATDFPSAPWALLWLDDGVKAKPPVAAGYPRDRHFRDRGLVSLRSGWTADDLHCTIFSGRRGRTTHSQMDQNQVTLYARGERFLIDLGYHLRDPRTGEPIAANATAQHNLVTIDGQGQFGRTTAVGWEEGRIDTFVSEAEYAFVLADARECYGANGQILRAERHLFFSRRRGCAPYVILLDDVAVDDGEEAHDYVLRLHTDPMNRIAGEGVLWRFLGKAAQLDVHIAGSGELGIRTEQLAGLVPRLVISQRAPRARFVILLHPRGAGEPAATFSAAMTPDAVEAGVAIGDAKHRYCFDTAWPQPELVTGAERHVPQILA